ncbi:MAG: hypothetical protein JHC85_12915, partial [Chthoniobacterales bacterium]|nr:hypothetical protein [Chthoniobacterales bacterium]
MKSFRLTALALAASFAAFAPAHANKPEKDGNRLGEVTQTVARMLESAHFSRQRLNNEVEPGVTQARKALDRYLELLDYNRLFFTQADIDEFTSKHGEWIHEDILAGNLKPAYDIYDRFISRVEARVSWIGERLQGDFTFDSDRTAQINRDKLPWPASEAEADKIWSDRLEAELLQAIIADQALEEAAAKRREEASKEGGQSETEKTVEAAPASPPKRTPVETVAKRYERLLKTLQEENREDQAATFLSALAQSYDPHSEYMSQRALDNFNIQMGLSLV